MKKTFALLFVALMQAATMHMAEAQNPNYTFEESLAARQTVTLPAGYTGKGVLVAVIEQEGHIDFNHINFLDPNTGQTRVRTAAFYEGGKLVKYTKPEEIGQLGPYTDQHGTHVAGLAAGSYAADGWQGIATEADLCLVGKAKDHTTEALKMVFAVADSLGLPMVVNLSYHEGTLMDGYNEEELLFEALTENGDRPGRIIVVSSANDGKNPLCYESAIGKDGKALIAIDKMKFSPTDAETYLSFSFEALKDQDLQFRYFLYDKAAKAEVTTGMNDFFGEPVDVSSFGQYLTSNVNEQSPYRYYKFEVEDPVMFDSDDIVLGVEITGAEGTALRYASGFASIDDGYFTPVTHLYGKPSPFAMTPAVLSVGNYDPHTPGRTPINATSSFGTNKAGGKIPDVVAPGTGIISSANTAEHSGDIYASREVTMADGSSRTFWWRTMSGTSQSSPIVAGLCALMLQYDPALTVNRVRQLLHSTNDWNDDCVNAPMGEAQAGQGILNTRALFEALMGEGTAIEDLRDADETLHRKAAKYFNGDGFVIEHAGRKYNVAGMRIE